MPGFLVDQHPEKKRIIEELLAGRPTRSIGLSVVPRMAHSAIQRYKDSVIKPMLARQAYETHVVIGRKREVVPPEAAQAIQESIQDAPVASIFRERLEKLHYRIDRGLDRAEASADLAPLAPLLNQAHKNLEILGRATGELEQSPGAGVSIQIICPWAPDRERMPRVSFAADAGEVQFEAGDVFQDVKVSPAK